MRAGMALLGAATLKDLKPEYVRTYMFFLRDYSNGYINEG